MNIIDEVNHRVYEFHQENGHHPKTIHLDEVRANRLRELMIAHACYSMERNSIHGIIYDGMVVVVSDSPGISLAD